MPEMPITYYGRRQRHAYWAGALLIAAAVGLRGASGAPWSGGVLQILLAIVQAAIAAGLVIAGPGSARVTVGPRGVEVRNMLRTHRVRWADVRGFSLDEERFPYVARLETAEGELAVQAISDEPWISWGAERERNRALIDTLNGHWRTVLTGRRSGTDSPAPAPTPALGS